MELKVIGSSSKGNCYILENESECLVIELGFAFSEIKKALGFKPGKVIQVLLSHNHGDHSKGLVDALNHGMKVSMSAGCAEKMGVTHRLGVNIMKHGDIQKFGNFTVMAFDAKHDVPEPLGFVIHHPITGTICFLTDSFYSEFTFGEIDHFLVEANYDDEILDQNLANGTLHPAQYRRTKASHMSITQTIKFIKAHEVSRIKNIVLLHLSANNSSDDTFKRKVIEQVGKRCQIARPGSKINLSLKKFQ